MFDLFVVGTFWFWALVIAEIVLLFVFVNYDNGIGATISLLAFGACLQWFGGVDILNYVTSHPLAMCLAVLGYLLAGVTWSVTRWWLFCRERLQKYNALKAEFLEQHNVPVGTQIVPEELRERWMSRLKSEVASSVYRDEKLCDKPLARKHKNQIISWMAFWVVSMIWFFVNDFIKGIFKEIYVFVSGFMQRIADNMFAHVNEDLKTSGRDSASKDSR